jgi:hypothetical protein
MADNTPEMDVEEKEAEKPSSSNVKGEEKRIEVRKVTSLSVMLLITLTDKLFDKFFSGVELPLGVGVN